MRAVSVILILDCEQEEISDAVNELLRPLQQSHGSESCLVDYGFSDVISISVDKKSKEYKEGDAFT